MWTCSARLVPGYDQQMQEYLEETIQLLGLECKARDHSHPPYSFTADGRLASAQVRLTAHWGGSVLDAIMCNFVLPFKTDAKNIQAAWKDNQELAHLRITTDYNELTRVRFGNSDENSPNAAITSVEDLVVFEVLANVAPPTPARLATLIARLAEAFSATGTPERLPCQLCYLTHGELRSAPSQSRLRSSTLRQSGSGPWTAS